MSKKGSLPSGRNLVSGRALQGIIEEVERIREDKKALGEQEKAIFAGAKAAGFMPGTIRDVLKIRAAKPADLEEAQSRLDMYLHAIGMAHETPLFRSVGMMNVDLAARDEVINAFKLLVPVAGEIIVKIGAQPVRLWRDENGEAHAEDIDETPAAASRPKKKKSDVPERSNKDIPAVDEAGARELGRTTYQQNEPITANPFPYGDERRPAFDAGWREASGTDGMGPEEDD